MKRIALVHPRYGLEISGGSETYAGRLPSILPIGMRWRC